MAYFFLILILIFAGTSFFYLTVNDFSRETLEVLFPAVGAILLSAYLGFKSVILDAPAPKEFGVSFAVLHDTVNGQIRGMAPRGIRHLPRFMEFRGADLIDTLPLYNAFKDLDLSKTLRDVSDDLNCPAQVLIENFVEYAVLRWLCSADMRVGSSVDQTVQLIHGQSGGISIPRDLVETPVCEGKEERNPLLRALPIKIPLPEGSTVSRPKDKRLSFEIVTRHSKLQFRCSGGAMETLDHAIGQEAEHIHEALDLPKKVDGVRMHGFNLEFTAKQFPFRRFSKQAKIEGVWINRLQEQFEKDFSWARLRRVYTSK